MRRKNFPYVLAVSRVSCASLARRLERTSRAGNAALRRSFTAKEWLRARRFARPEESLAARLAAKRALARSLALTGFHLPEYLFDRIEIRNLRSGSPVLRVIDRSLRQNVLPSGRTILLSLTHSRLWGAAAVAFRK